MFGVGDYTSSAAISFHFENEASIWAICYPLRPPVPPSDPISEELWLKLDTFSAGVAG